MECSLSSNSAAAKNREAEIQQILEILHKWGIHTLGQLAALDKEQLEFGNARTGNPISRSGLSDRLNHSRKVSSLKTKLKRLSRCSLCCVVFWSSSRCG